MHDALGVAAAYKYLISVATVHSDLLTLNSDGGIKLFPEVREGSEAVLDACKEDDNLLLSHALNSSLPLNLRLDSSLVIDDLSKVGKLRALDTVAEDAEEELDLRSAV